MPDQETSNQNSPTDRDAIEAIKSRRNFLQLAALGTSFIGFGALEGFVFPSSAMADCSPPASNVPAKKVARDCRRIMSRRPASTLSSSEITKLKNAYQAMRDLDTSDPNDPRGFTRQANIHCWMCAEASSTQWVHGNWKFFAWHRAYLYYHERILGKLINDMDFRLPYWDWDVSSHRRLPSAYTSPNNATNPLWNGTRDMSPTDELPDEDVGEDVMEASMTAGTFAEFGGTASADGIPEGAPHGSVHVDVGGFFGDMGAFETAGKDPVFYAHHSNVDKMWSDWNKGSSSHTNPTEPAFLNLSWNFYDENKVWRSIKASDVLNHENQLRYIYGPSKFMEILPCLVDWIGVRTDWQVARTLKLAQDSRVRIARVLDSGGRARMHLTDVVVPVDKSAVYRLYASPEAAKEDKGPGSDGYLGTIPVVLNDRKGRHAHKRTRNVVVNITRRKFERLSGAQPQLTLVERRTKGSGERKIVPVAARDVHFTVADVER